MKLISHLTIRTHFTTSTVRVLLISVMVILMTGCSVFGVRNIEQADYTVVEKKDDYEIRQYETIVVAETWVDGDFDQAGDKAFKRLFNYISGENAGSREIAMTAPVIATDEEAGDSISMTAPVIAENNNGNWNFAFVLPASFTLETAPLPTSDLIKLAERPGKKVVVLRFNGFWDDKKISKKTEELLSWMQTQNLKASSLPRVAGYDPPWTLPFLRRNEVMVDLDE